MIVRGHKPMPKPSLKLQQFQDELNKLCDRYLYRLVPKLSYTDKGILPIVVVSDVIPPVIPPPLAPIVPQVTKIKKASQPVK
jgi:hypothetical protein